MSTVVDRPRGGRAASASPATGAPADLAHEACLLADADPRLAERLAQEALRLLDAERDGEAECRARLALGLVARVESRLTDALAHLQDAAALARDQGRPGLWLQSQCALVPVLAQRGDYRPAGRIVEEALPQATGVDRANLLFLRGYVLQAAGDLAAALDAYRPAELAFRRLGADSYMARLLNNRAMILVQRGAYDRALDDLRAAAALHERLGERRKLVDIWANLGWTLAMRGELVESLRMFDRVDAYYAERDEIDPLALIDRSDALMEARLIPEARAAALRAADELDRIGSSRRWAEAQLQLAQLALLDVDPAAARQHAAAAAAAFRSQGRSPLSALADFALLQIDHEEGGEVAPETLLARARAVAERLAGTGWSVPALDARLIVARTALSLGRPAEARRELAGIVGATRRGPAQRRLRAWHARALLHLAEGDPRAARSSLRAGLEVLSRHRESLGATELRAVSSAAAQGLVSTAMDLAIASGDPRQVFTWAEAARAGSLWMRPPRPDPASGIGRDLEALRAVTAEIEEVAAAGGDLRRLVGRQTALEQEIRRQTLTVPAGDRHPARVVTGPAAVRRLLGDRILLEIVQHAGRLLGVVLRGRALPRSGGPAIAVVDLGPLQDVVADLTSIRFSLRRLATGHGGARSRAGALEALSGAAARLDERLLGPLGRLAAGTGLVVVPTGALHALPWHVLPTCSGRPVTVVPSAELWVRSSRPPAPLPPGRRAGEGSVVLAAGPQLEQASAEIRQLAAAYPGASVLTGDDATVERVLAALERAGTAHVAAHGRVRSDNPHFSALQLADGPLTVYDLERLSRPPERLVLSACDAGLSDVRPGDELRGLVASLLSLGTRSVIASVVPVPDRDVVPLMLALHGALLDGLPPAAALAAARRHPDVDPGAFVAAGFVCFGSG